MASNILLLKKRELLVDGGKRMCLGFGQINAPPSNRFGIKVVSNLTIYLYNKLLNCVNVRKTSGIAAKCYKIIKRNYANLDLLGS